MPITTTSICAACRTDRPRVSIALTYDTEKDVKYLNLKKCSMCGVLKGWWWFLRWPLTEAEMDKV